MVRSLGREREEVGVGAAHHPLDDMSPLNEQLGRVLAREDDPSTDLHRGSSVDERCNGCDDIA
jgi:hypothetical protein